MHTAEATATEIRRTVEGQTYMFAPLSGKGWGRLLQWLKDHVVALAIKQLPDIEREYDKRLVMDRAYALAARLQLWGDDGVRLTPLMKPDSNGQSVAVLDKKGKPLLEAVVIDARAQEVSEIVDSVLLSNLEGMVQIIYESMRQAQHKGLAYKGKNLTPDDADRIMDTIDDPKGLLQEVLKISGQTMARWRGRIASKKAKQKGGKGA